jgi:hypothetical protein
MYCDVRLLWGTEENHKMASRWLVTWTRLESGIAVIYIRTLIVPGPNSLGVACTNEKSESVYYFITRSEITRKAGQTLMFSGCNRGSAPFAYLSGYRMWLSSVCPAKCRLVPYIWQRHNLLPQDIFFSFLSAPFIPHPHPFLPSIFISTNENTHIRKVPRYMLGGQECPHLTRAHLSNFSQEPKKMLLTCAPEMPVPNLVRDTEYPEFSNVFLTLFR